jgi:hypothetical protein
VNNQHVISENCVAFLISLIRVRMNMRTIDFDLCAVPAVLSTSLRLSPVSLLKVNSIVSRVYASCQLSWLKS